MGGAIKVLKPSERPKPAMTEAKMWLAACGAVAAGIAVASLFEQREGVQLASIASIKIGAALGLILAWGIFHLVSRRSNDAFMIVALVGTVATSSGRSGSFSEAFVISWVASAVGLGFVLLLNFRVPRGSKKSVDPQSDHLLYDAEVDAAGMGVVHEMSSR